MRDGDISNDMSHHVLWVFEGLLALPPAGHSIDYDVRRERKAHRILRRWTRPEMVYRRVWDSVFRGPFAHDAVTFMSPASAEAAEQWLERNNYPINNVYSATQALWPREVSFLPWVSLVLDPDPERAAATGPRAMYVTPDEPFSIFY